MHFNPYEIELKWKPKTFFTTYWNYVPQKCMVTYINAALSLIQSSCGSIIWLTWHTHKTKDTCGALERHEDASNMLVRRMVTKSKQMYALLPLLIMVTFTAPIQTQLKLKQTWYLQIRHTSQWIKQDHCNSSKKRKCSFLFENHFHFKPIH